MTITLPQAVFDAAKSMLIADEDIKFVPYRDSKRLWTIGVGRLIGDNLTDLKLSFPIVMQMLQEDIEKHYKEACMIFGREWLEAQLVGRQLAILTLVFTLGRTRLSAFHQTVPAIRRGQWDEAAELLKLTKWASDVDPLHREGEGRDDRICYMLRTGEIHADYKVNI